MNSSVVNRQFDSAREFVEAISPRGSIFGDDDPQRTWIFRGAPTARFDLLPSVMRPDWQVLLPKLSGYPDGISRPYVLAETQTISEAMVLWNLSIALNERGLAVPDGAALELETMLKLFLDPANPFGSHGLPEWPTHRVLPLMALAQHYGLPTRLLDWTRSAFVAAYFAARQPVTDDKVLVNEDAAVWAIDMDRFNNAPFGLRPKPVFAAVGAPRASNPNLNAQDGLFTVNWWKSSWGNFAIDRLSLNELARKVPDDDPILEGGPLLYCFTFPRSIAGELLWLLAKERVTAAKVFPDIYGVVSEMKERMRWERAKLQTTE